uniref:FGENESH: predicted gene_7.86 protein n=1 Tax=Rhodotorula toruloides TaxID=5286 RepID=A0A0K3CH41_RHOTO
MNFLSSISSSLISAGSAALANASGGVPGVQGYQLGDKVLAYEGKSIWTQWSGTKKDDSTPVSVFSFDLSSPSHISSHDRRSLFPLARNAFRKLRALRHPNILKFLDGSETDSAIWIVTEPVRSLALELEGHGGLSEESKVYGLLHVCTALGFLNRDGQSVHGGLRTTSVWVTPGGEWKLGGMEVCSRLDEPDGAMWHVGGLLPDSRTHAPPEVRRGGWTALKEYDASTLDSYLLHLFLYTIFNGPLPTSYLSPSASETPSLPQVRGSILPALFQPWRRLGNPNPAARLKTSAFLDLGNHPGEGWWTSNRLVKLSTALEGFSLATEDERMGLIRTLKAISSGAANAKTAPLPSGFLKYKVLPSLVHTLEFSSGSGGAPLLPVILDLSSSSDGSTNLDEKEYQRDVIQPLVRMYATPDRAIRMALLENLERYADKLQNKDVNEKVWPHLQTGFGDVVPVIREATVKAIPLIATKLNDRILNNDLLRVLSKTQTDVEPGIRTNTCILLSRLSRHLQTSTQRKVLIPAFARALRDPFVHARIAGLMALMATCEVFEKEDLAGKVIPAMSICLVDREKTVRDQAFKAIDMFVKKCESLTASMQSPALQAASQTQPGLATNAAGAAGALAGWAFASVSKKLSSAEMAAPIERRDSSQSISSVNAPATNGATVPASRTSTDSASASPQVPGGFGGVAKGTEDWGGDLIDVNDDDADWDEFESGQPVPARIDPFAARLSSSKPKPARGRGGSLRLGAASRSSGLRIPLDMDATDSWDLDESAEDAINRIATFLASFDADSLRYTGFPSSRTCTSSNFRTFRCDSSSTVTRLAPSLAAPALRNSPSRACSPVDVDRPAHRDARLPRPPTFRPTISFFDTCQYGVWNGRAH